MSGSVRAVELSAIPDGRAVTFEAGGRRLALFREGDRVHAISARCPHSAGPLDRGWIEDGEAVCPLHRWRFRLRDGRCSTVRGEWVATYPCEILDGWVWVGT